MTRDHAIEKTIGQSIRLARIEARMSQGLLGDSIGVTFQQIQKYESGKDRVAVSTLLRIAKTLGKPASFFLEPNDQAVALADAPRRDVKALVRIASKIEGLRSPRLRAIVERLVDELGAEVENEEPSEAPARQEARLPALAEAHP